MRSCCRPFEILASVWHSPDDDEIYEIESSDLFITLSNRDVVLSRAPTAPGDIGVHGLTLRILDSARAVTALQTVQVFVGVEPPLVYVDRTRGDGSDGNPFLIYDIHQLQAMGGTIAPMVAASIAVSLGLEEAVVIDIAQNLFGDGRATAVYQLTQNIDASETRYWDRADDGDGFIPIDGFGGELRGAGKIIDGLYIRSNARAGLFAEARSVTVSRLGLDNIEIDAVGVAGGLAAVWDQGLASVVWARGRVGGDSRVGGLVGEFTNSTLVGGWFAGEIGAATNGNAGGLIGNLSDSSVRDNWAIGRVSVGNQFIRVGGLFGQVAGSSVENNWSGSSAENANSPGGVVPGGGAAGSTPFDQTYWGLEISGIPSSAFNAGIGIANLQTLSVSAWDDAWANLDADEDYPILKAHEDAGEGWPGEQALGIAFGLTRLLAINGDNPIELAPGQINVAADERYAVMRLDVNGFASNNRRDQTPSANCESTVENGRDGFLATVYNGVTIEMNVISEGATAVTELGLCGLGWAVEPSDGLQTVRIRASVGDRDWVRDYPISLEIALTLVDPISLDLDPVPLVISVGPGRAGVAYDAVATAEVLTVQVISGVLGDRMFSVSNDNFALTLTNEGDIPILVLAADATAIFTVNGMEVEVEIEVTDQLDSAIAATVTVFSLPRPWPGDASTYSVTITAATAGLAVLPAASVRTSIWHAPPGSGWTIKYLLEGDENGYFGVNDDNGQISITRAPAVGGYDITLVQQAVFNDKSESAVRATQNLRVEIMAGAFYYTNGQRLGAGVESDPYLIYDIYQLQAIGGALPPEAASDASSQNTVVIATEGKIAAAASVLFGADADERLSAHYRLAQDIDASQTRNWTGGFAPIAADGDFVGRFDGGGNRISDLFVNSAGNAGLFAQIGANGVVMSVGLENAEIILNGDGDGSYAGVLAARVDGGRVSVVWARGAQVDAVGAGAIAGGLVGYLSGASEIVDNWFSGEVEGMVAGGGLIGVVANGGLADDGAVRANWAVARTQGATVGGFAARAGGGEWLRNWSSGRAIGVNAEAGFANPRTGANVNEALTMAFASNYWSEDASGNTATNGVLGSAIPTAQEIHTNLAEANQWASEWRNVAPTDDDLFPVLLSQDADLQAVAIADGLVELQSFFGDDIATLDYRSVNTIAPTVSIRLDINGAAAADTKPIADCVVDFPERILRTGLFNGVSVQLQLSEFFSLSAENGCDIEILPSGNPEFILPSGVTVFHQQRADLIIFAGTVTVTRGYELGVDEEDARRARYAATVSVRWLADDDGDGRINAYDRTPAGDESFDFWRVEGVTLDGSTRDRAYPIYNIWHLQAMDGYALPPEVAASISAAATAAGVDIENEITAAREFFDPPAEALTASYQLARSFGAGAAREWNAGAGFTAIGGGDGGSFTGALYGVDFVIDGLFARAPIGGLFARLGAGALVERVGLEGVDMEVSLRAIEQPQPLGAFAAYLTGATIAQSWARGRVVGEDSVGGLIGGLIGSATAGAAEISLSWFAGDVEARGDAVGGVAGYIGSDDAVIVDSWAAARVIGGAAVGGLVGGGGGTVRNSWAGGAVSVVDARTTMFGGLVGQSPFRGAQTKISIEESYWSSDASGVDGATGSGRAFGVSVKTAQTLTVAGWSDVSWNFGDIDIDSSPADFPVLRYRRPDNIDDDDLLQSANDDFASRQGAAIAFGLTRVSWMTDGLEGALRAGAPTAIADGVTVTFDFNGLAAEDDSASPRPGVCDDEVLPLTIPVSLSYNDVIANIVFPQQVTFDRDASNDCAGVLRFVGDETAATVVVEYFSAGGAPVRAEYPLTTGEDALRAAFLAALESDTARWLDDDDNDNTINAYDHSPRPGVVLFDEEIDYGGADNPRPVYNIWQLQAIDGVAPDDVPAGMRAVAQNFYGANSTARLTAFYEMQVDIDATPTRDWDGGLGFAPIGDAADAFRGVFDGGGNVVRGLRIDRADDNIGLFAALNATVVNVGLDDARITGGNNVGAIVGSISVDGDLQRVWARGRVQGGDNVGGLAGRLDSAGLSSSWFVGQVEGDDAVGGLAGYALSGSDAADSWAAVDIVAPADSRAGELAGRADAAATLSRLWGEGYLSADFSALGGDLAAVHTVGVRALNDDAFQNAPIWNVGTNEDFPILTVHSAAMQGAAIASGLTRILGGPLTAALEYGTINYVGDSARFSIEFADDSVAPICSIVDAAVFDVDGGLPLAAPPRQALVATLGYNNVETRLLAPVGFSFVAAEGDCAATLTPAEDGFALAGEVVLEAQFIADGELLRREHRVFLGFSEERTDFFVENVDWIAGLFDGEPFALLDDADGDGSPNTYDYTPLPGIDLTLRLSVSLSGSENVGIKNAPYPIFNIWQLQAIGGTVQGIDPENREMVLQAFFEGIK